MRARAVVRARAAAECSQYSIRRVAGVVRGLRVRAHFGKVGTVTSAPCVHASWCTLAPGRWSFRAVVQRKNECDFVLWTSRLPSYLPGGGWPRCRSARAFLGPQLVARAIKKVARRSRVRAGHAAHALSCTTMSGACGRAARDGRGTRGQSSGQGQIQGYRTDAKKSLTKYLETTGLE